MCWLTSISSDNHQKLNCQTFILLKIIDSSHYVMDQRSIYGSPLTSPWLHQLNWRWIKSLPPLARICHSALPWTSNTWIFCTKTIKVYCTCIPCSVSVPKNTHFKNYKHSIFKSLSNGRRVYCLSNLMAAGTSPGCYRSL